jgi:hypothetical protein
VIRRLSTVQIAEAVYQVLYEGQDVVEMAHGLMTRPIAEDELGLPKRSEVVDGLLRKLGLNDTARP